MKPLEILLIIKNYKSSVFLNDENELVIKQHHLLSSEIIKQANLQYQDIKDLFIKWSKETPEEKTVRKLIHQLCGWTKNQKIIDFLNNNEASCMMAYDLCIELSNNGWKDLYDDYSIYHTNTSRNMMKQLYMNAMNYYEVR